MTLTSRQGFASLASRLLEHINIIASKELDTLLEQFQQLSGGGSTSQKPQKTCNVVSDSAKASCTGGGASRASRPGPTQLDLVSVKRRAQDLFECVKNDQFVKAKSNLNNLSKEEKQKIVKESFDGNTPLFLAAQQGHVNFVNYLLEECGADIEQRGVYIDKDRDGKRFQVTPLWYAAFNNKLEVVKTLIRHRANVNATTDTESTPVRSACYMTNIEVVKCLVENGADIHKPNINGGTCLINSVKSVDLCSFLIQKGANVNAQDIWGETALHHAIDKGGIETAKLLFKHNPNVNAQSNFGDIALHCAIREGKIEMVKLLLKYNSNPYLKNKDGDDALQTSSLQGQTDILEYLISKIKPSVERQVEVYELLGCYFVHQTDDIQRALQIWRSAMELRCQDPNNVIKNTTVIPLIQEYNWAREPESLEELQEIASNPDMVYMLGLLIRERILGPDHEEMIFGIEYRGAVYADTHHYQRCVDLWKYAFKLRRKQKKSVKKCLQALERLCRMFWEINKKRVEGLTNEAVQFSDVIEVLEMALSELEWAQEAVHQLSKPNQPGPSHPKEEFHTMLLVILHLIHLLCKMPKDEQQMCRFKKAVHLLVRLNPQTHQGSKLLHLAVQQQTTYVGNELSKFPSLDVVKVLIECGTDVNCVDDYHNTPLHICSLAENRARKTEEIVRYLIAHDADPDASNIVGQKAALFSK